MEIWTTNSNHVLNRKYKTLERGDFGDGGKNHLKKSKL